MQKNEKISKFLKSVYGEEIFNEKVDKLSKPEFKDLCENLQNGIAISTPGIGELVSNAQLSISSGVCRSITAAVTTKDSKCGGKKFKEKQNKM